MQFSQDNFLTGLKGLVTGGGRDSSNNPKLDSGFWCHSDKVSLTSLSADSSLAAITDSSAGTANSTIQAMPDPTDSPATADALRDDLVAVLIPAIRNNFADVAAALNKIIARLGMTADETNAKVIKVEETVDTIGTITWSVPRDYDETTDIVKVRVLASQLTVSTDNDVQLDAQVYLKTPGSALGSDLNPTAPGTILSTTEQWIEFTLAGNGFERDDVVYFTLITNGANDTGGEEVLIHDVQFVYSSCLVSFDEANASNVGLR